MSDLPPESPGEEEFEPSESGEQQASADGGPRVVGVDSEEADALLGVLSSGTAREVLEAVHEEPATASGLADRLDLSLQMAHYHLRNLTEAGVIEVDGTETSEKGQEMDVYAPAEGPVVVFAGDEADGSDLRDALARLASGFGVLAVVSLLVQEVLGGGVDQLFGPSEPAGGEPIVAETAREATGIEPGLVFFAGGAAVLLAGFALWYWSRYRVRQ